MNAVATITPDPKYLQIKYTMGGNRMNEYFDDNNGSNVPIALVTMMTKMEEILVPIFPL